MKISWLTVVEVILCCIISTQSLWSQNTSVDSRDEYALMVAKAYGQDQELINGMQYYNNHPLSSGNPYLLGGAVHKGSVTIHGKYYQDIWLRYDIYYQHVEVEYQTINGADNRVILVGDRLDEFRIGKLCFRKIAFDEWQGQFYHETGTGRMVFYIAWEKRLIPVSSDPRIIENFTSAKRNYLVNLDGTVHIFKNKKNLIKLLPEIVQKDVKKLFRKYGIHLKGASPAQLEMLLQEVSDLLNEG